MINHIFTQWVNERINVPTRLPDFRIHQNRRIDAIYIIALVNKHPPPQIHNVSLQLNAQRTVVPRSRQTTVNIRTLINKTAALTQANNIFHFCLTHQKNLSPCWQHGDSHYYPNYTILLTILHCRVLSGGQPAIVYNLSYSADLRHIRERLCLNQPH